MSRKKRRKRRFWPLLLILLLIALLAAGGLWYLERTGKLKIPGISAKESEDTDGRAVLVLSNLIISLLRKVIPDEVRLPSYIVVVASLVTVTELLIKAYLPSIYSALGLFIPLSARTAENARRSARRERS
jgi:hypothetical protein